MNLEVILFHLLEAKEQLDSMITEIPDNPEYDIGEFRVEMGHVYHHLNTAWNGRDQADEQFKKCTDVDFAQFRRFPPDADLLLD